MLSLAALVPRLELAGQVEQSADLGRREVVHGEEAAPRQAQLADPVLQTEVGHAASLA